MLTYIWVCVVGGATAGMPKDVVLGNADVDSADEVAVPMIGCSTGCTGCNALGTCITRGSSCSC